MRKLLFGTWTLQNTWTMEEHEIRILQDTTSANLLRIKHITNQLCEGDTTTTLFFFFKENDSRFFLNQQEQICPTQTNTFINNLVFELENDSTLVLQMSYSVFENGIQEFYAFTGKKK